MLRPAPDFAGDELRALDHVLRRVERFRFIGPNYRRERALQRAWSTRAPWDLLTAAAHATRAAASILRGAAHTTNDRAAEDATHEGLDLMDAAHALAVASLRGWR